MGKSNKQQTSIGTSSFLVLAAGALIAAVLFVSTYMPNKARADDIVTVSFETEASYTMGPGDSEPLACKLAFFRASLEAAHQAANRFAEQRLIQFGNRDKSELVCLVADNLRAEPIWDHWNKEGGVSTYTVRIHAVVRLSDFIGAQLAILSFSRKEATENFRDEMSPPIPALFSPGLALAKAYWLIRNDELRISIIYLDRLTQRYPNWREAYEVKAMALGLQNKAKAMQ